MFFKKQLRNWAHEICERNLLLSGEKWKKCDETVCTLQIVQCELCELYGQYAHNVVGYCTDITCMINFGKFVCGVHWFFCYIGLVCRFEHCWLNCCYFVELNGKTYASIASSKWKPIKKWLKICNSEPCSTIPTAELR